MPFQILSLSGGGYRGLFSAHILARLEDQVGRPIGECFDLIAGTSIGGIIAIGLALGNSAKTIREVFLDKGEDIFTRAEPTRNPFSNTQAFVRGLLRPRYDGTELRKAIEAVVGADALIGHARTRLLVPTVNMTAGKVQMFKTAHHPKLATDSSLNAADVAMATSAAPMFFPMARVGESYFVDGGIVANAPDLCAMHEATRFLDQSVADIRILSIGMITTGFSLPTSLRGNFGVWAWIKNQRLLSAMFSSQQLLVDAMVKHQLAERYVRLDDKPAPEQTSDLGLDVASKDRRGTLLAMADKVFQEHCRSAMVLSMLAHAPQSPTFYNSSQAGR